MNLRASLKLQVYAHRCINDLILIEGFGVDANIVALSGIAIAIGVMVDIVL